MCMYIFVVQAGVVAWGLGCGEEGVPGVYGAVAPGVCWIDYAASCRKSEPVGGGDGDEVASYFGYGQQCTEWMEGKLARRKGRGGRRRKNKKRKQQFLPKPIRAKYEECKVRWEQR